MKCTRMQLKKTEVPLVPIVYIELVWGFQLIHRLRCAAMIWEPRSHCFRSRRIACLVSSLSGPLLTNSWLDPQRQIWSELESRYINFYRRKRILSISFTKLRFKCFNLNSMVIRAVLSFTVIVENDKYPQSQKLVKSPLTGWFDTTVIPSVYKLAPTNTLMAVICVSGLGCEVLFLKCYIKIVPADIWDICARGPSWIIFPS